MSKTVPKVEPARREATQPVFRTDAPLVAECVRMLLALLEIRAGVINRNPWGLGAGVADVLVFLGEHSGALASLREMIERRDLPEWQCDSCGEDNPPTFDLCWQCGTTYTPPASPEPTAAQELISIEG